MHSPRRFSHPSKNSTRPQPHHVTVAVAPLPFPPRALASSDRLRCQSRPSEIRSLGAPASRPCSAVESVTPSDRCQPAAPYPSWASFPFKVLLPHPCGRDRRRHRRSGRGIELRSVVLSTRAVHAVTRTSRRQAWGAEDTGKPGSSTGHDPCEPCPPDAALAAPGTESLRGFTESPLARRSGAPGVCPEPKWARRVHRSPPGLTRAGSDGRIRRPSWGS